MGILSILEIAMWMVHGRIHPGTTNLEWNACIHEILLSRTRQILTNLQSHQSVQYWRRKASTSPFHRVEVYPSPCSLYCAEMYACCWLWSNPTIQVEFFSSWIHEIYLSWVDAHWPDYFEDCVSRETIQPIIVNNYHIFFRLNWTFAIWENLTGLYRELI